MEKIFQFMILKKNKIAGKNKNKNKKFSLQSQKKKTKMYSNKNVNKIVKNCGVSKKTEERGQIYEF